jgi:hypothetical protein
MKGIVFSLVFVLLAVMTAYLSYAAEEKPTVTVEGIRIVTKGYAGQEDLRAFSLLEGATITLMVFMPEGGIVDFKRDDSKLESVTDDKGTDLTKADKKNTWGSITGFDAWPKKSKDTKAILIDALTPAAPKEGASTIALKGKLIISVGTKTETTETKDVALGVGEKIKAGSLELEIERLGKGWGDYEFSLALKGKGRMAIIKAVQFLDENGKEIESSPSGSASYGEEFTIDYQLKKKVSKATVKVECWSDLKDVEVPLDIKTGIGIGK